VRGEHRKPLARELLRLELEVRSGLSGAGGDEKGRNAGSAPLREAFEPGLDGQHGAKVHRRAEDADHVKGRWIWRVAGEFDLGDFVSRAAQVAGGKARDEPRVAGAGMRQGEDFHRGSIFSAQRSHNCSMCLKNKA
jgi:hypothetical protein